MTRVVTFTVPGVAQPKGSMKAFQPKGFTRPIITSDNPRLKDWQQQIALHAGIAIRGELFTGPVTLYVAFRLPRPKSMSQKAHFHVKKPDLDKLVRATKDALTGVAYHDDSQVTDLHATKRYVHRAAAPAAAITLSASAPNHVEDAMDLLACLVEDAHGRREPATD